MITGCSTGMGNASARLFAKNGWNVVATARTPASIETLAGANVATCRLDVTDPDSIAAAIDAGIARFGDIDAVLNNAGFGLYGVFESLSDADIRKMFETNLFGVMNVVRAILPHFRAKNSGSIINISSGGGMFALPAMSIYCSSKFALEGYSEGIYHELGALGISVKLIEPGGVLTTPFDSSAVARMEAALAPEAYGPFLEGTTRNIAVMRDNAKATADDVAQAIYAAATDGTDRLRYVVTDDIKELVRLRHEVSEEAYMAFVKDHIVPKI
nr:SDR family oxidoreductase [Sphingobium sp. EM0848]